MSSLDGRVALITGSTRGIGKALALELAEHGCKIVVTGKTDEPRPDLPGTIYKTAEAVEEVGSEALPLKLDVRKDEEVEDVIDQTVDKWGRLDILVNNAGAIHLQSFLDTPPKRYDLVNEVNARASYVCSYYAIQQMLEQDYGHVLMASPPVATDSFPNKAAYGLSKIGMTVIAKSLAEEYKNENIGVNAFWPVTAIESEATRHFGLGDETMWRTPQILCDTVLEILKRDPSECSGNAFYDEEVLREAGVEDFSKYSVVEGTNPPPLSAQMFDPDFDYDQLA